MQAARASLECEWGGNMQEVPGCASGMQPQKYSKKPRRDVQELKLELVYVQICKA